MVRIIGKRQAGKGKPSDTKKNLVDSLDEGKFLPVDYSSDGTNTGLNLDVDEEKPKHTLPLGWQRKVRTRKSGIYAGKAYVHILNGDGRLFRSKKELKSYCDENFVQDVDIEQLFKIDEFDSENVKKTKTSKDKDSKENTNNNPNEFLDVEDTRDDEDRIENLTSLIQNREESMDDNIIEFSENQESGDDTNYSLNESEGMDDNTIEFSENQESGDDASYSMNESDGLDDNTIEFTENQESGDDANYSLNESEGLHDLDEEGSEENSDLSESLPNDDIDGTSSEVDSVINTRQCFVVLERIDVDLEIDRLANNLTNEVDNDQNSASENERPLKSNEAEHKPALKHAFDNSIPINTDKQKYNRIHSRNLSYIMDQSHFKRYEKYVVKRPDTSIYNHDSNNNVEEIKDVARGKLNGCKNGKKEHYYNDTFALGTRYNKTALAYGINQKEIVSLIDSIDLKACLDMAINIRNERRFSGTFHTLPYA